MYLVFAQLIVMLFYPTWLSHLTYLNIKIGFISFLLLFATFLCSSKMGLITAFILIPSALFVILYKRGYKKLIIGSIVVFIIGLFVSYKFLPKPFERIKVAFKVTASAERIDKTDAESTAVRILIWKESVKLITSNFGLESHLVIHMIN